MDVMASMIILVPLLAPIGLQLGYDSVNWGVLIVLLFCMGGITPPLGISLFIATSIAGCKYIETAKAVIPFVLILVIAIFFVAFIPSLTTFLPSLLMR
jgi:C4-dicarboxylate transporter DctM subunit